MIRLKKVVLFPEIGRVRTFLSPNRLHSQMCIRTYIFNFNNKKKQEDKKQKKLKKKREGCDDAVYREFALCTFN